MVRLVVKFPKPEDNACFSFWVGELFLWMLFSIRLHIGWKTATGEADFPL